METIKEHFYKEKEEKKKETLIKKKKKINEGLDRARRFLNLPKEKKEKKKEGRNFKDSILFNSRF